MLASDATFLQMRKAAKKIQSLGIPASYLQVEYGLSELEACWDGFVHTSDHFSLTFKTKTAIYTEFANSLNEYLDYLGESVPVEMGSKISPNS